MKPRRQAPSTALPSEIDEASLEFEGRWQRLVSSTNWEKGRIIGEWRAALMAHDAPVQEYADDAWSRRVGGVTGQHVGRLRRVWERFGSEQATYDGLSWSHFQAALDWEDAEMWLEGAVQSHWSVAGMRQARWEARGAPAEQKPRPEDVISTELDEDFLPPGDEPPALRGPLAELHPVEPPAESAGPTRNAVLDPATCEESDGISTQEETAPWEADAVRVPAKSAPFAGLPQLPDDLAEAIELFKLAIVRHRQDGWQIVAPADVLAHLGALEALVTASSATD